jgi:phospholipase C
MRVVLAVRLAALGACVATAGACSLAPHSAPNGAVPFVSQQQLLRSTASSSKIQHVVIIFQENRSFDNLFQGFPGADTVSGGKNSKGQTILLRPVGLATQFDIDHSFEAMLAACNGKGKTPGTKCRMNGFDREQAFGGPKNPQYVYVPHSDSKPYFDMAHEFVVADHMFQSQLDESFVAHQYIIAAQAHRAVDVPNDPTACAGPNDIISTLAEDRGPGPFEEACFNYTTLGDELDVAGLTWRFYTSQILGDGGTWSG